MIIAPACLTAIALFAIERFNDSDILQAVRARPPSDRFFLICLGLVPSLLVFTLTRRALRGPRHRLATSIFVVVLLAFAPFVFTMLSAPGNNAAAIAALGAIAATIGWLLQRQAAIDISRKQHTLNILLQLRQNDLFNKHKTNIFAFYPDRQVIPAAEAGSIYDQRLDPASYQINDAGLTTWPLIESIRYVRNDYEFLSAAVYHSDIDDALFRSSIGNIMTGSYAKFEHVMDLAATMVRYGHPTPETTYYYFWWLTDRHGR